ncbi:unnamed protein product [Phytomonas sp. Hart1]|nr:unnamed protein product [Phytomonas sp. Hart1]|eukprot:CCW72185.1 unnamed protein product [Phytomonas sp. isolate Hart1]
MEVQSLRIKTNARAACSVRNEVWLALQNGGLGVYDAETHEHLKDVPIDIDGFKNPRIKLVAAILKEVWAIASEGQIFSVNGLSCKVTRRLQVYASKKKAEVMDMSFNGSLVILASEAGYVLTLHPNTMEVLFSISISAPCTAVVQFSSLIAAGDCKGALYLCDTQTQKCILVHTEGKDDVLKLLYDTTCNRLWVARRNGNIDLYDFEPSNKRLLLYKRLLSVGIVTGMVAMSGRVIVSTFEKKLVVIDSGNAHILHTSMGIHKKFIHDVVKVRHTEIAEVWSLGNDGAVCVWFVTVRSEPIYVPPLIDDLPVLDVSPCPSINVTEAKNEPSKVPTIFELNKHFDILDNLRQAREEAQEMRLRSIRLEELLKVKNDEIETKYKEMKNLEDRISALTKDVIDITSEKRSMERERAILQSELNFTKSETFRVSGEAASQMSMRIRAEEEVSQKKVDIIHLERRLRDAESQLASVQIENTQLRRSVDISVVTQRPGMVTLLPMIESQALTKQELEKALSLNYSLNSALRSMEFTLRCKEEEEKDLNVLLNAYRLKAADRVSDSCLSALLIASITRCPERFELYCDDQTLSELRAYTNPFINYLVSLRNGDPETYQGLVNHLHQYAIDGSISLQTQQHLDRLLILAFEKGDLVGADTLAAFKRAISCQTTRNYNDNHALGTSPTSNEASPPPNRTSDLSGSFSLSGLRGAEPARNFAVPISTSVSKSVAGISSSTPTLADKTNIDKYREVFEFILFTRRPLVEHLVHLHQWTINIRQKVEALSLEDFLTSILSIQSSTSTQVSSHVDLIKSFKNIGPMITEIDELVSFLVRSYLTAAEKQRLSVG